MPKLVLGLLTSLLLLAHPVAAEAASATSSQSADQMVYNRAVNAAIWGQPIVSFDAMRQAYFRDAKAKYNDIIWWPKGADWKNQSLTVNTTVRYIYIFCNTKQDGPVVVGLPPGNTTASFFGTFEDAWFVPLTDIGDGGKGGKYLMLPPDYTGAVPPGYIVLRPRTYNSYLLLRSIVASDSDHDVSVGNAQVKQLKVYPLSEAAHPPEQRLIDMTDTQYNGLTHYDSSLYTSLAGMLNEEPVQPRDLQMMGMLLPLGIEKGAPFNPDAETVAQLNSASAAAHAWLVAQSITAVTPWWPKSQWVIPVAPIGVKTLFHWETPNYFDVDSRGIALSTFFGPTATLGGGSFYLATYHDGVARPLDGGHTYRFHVPANVPVSQFWAVTVYGLETSALFPNSTRLTVSSLDKSLSKNADNSADLYFGPTPPAGHESNWLYTPNGQKWFPWFRFYGPQKALLDKSWTMPDIEMIDH
jgi:hypothetical protein